ncbi:MAG: hypothetical protein N2Z72_07945 [Bacteroidales bacterium]|nr:hypothetical protein [Bacteroidales bacterium]
MAKHFISLLLFVTYGIIYGQQKVPRDGKKIAKKFAMQVTEKNIKKTMSLLDASFKQVQLIGLLNNDTLAFLNKLFCDKNQGGTCVKFDEISKCTFKRVGKFTASNLDYAMAPVVFYVKTKNGITFEVNLMLVRYFSGGKKKFIYRIGGPVG